MKCIYCGEDTFNKTNNQVMCKSHSDDARVARDKHNAEVRSNCKSSGEYLVTSTKSYYDKTTAGLDYIYKTTASYHLNKLYQERNDSKDKATI